MKNQEISKIDLNQDEYVCVEIDDIHPLKLMTRVREKAIQEKTHIINERKDLRDFILTITEDRLHHKTPAQREYIVGTLVKYNNRVLFKPLCTDQYILLASDCISFSDNYFYTPKFNFEASLGEIKILSPSDVQIHSKYYPNDYADREEIRNLVLNNALCVEIESLKKLTDLADDGIWELTFNEEFSDEYAKKLKKKKLFAQKNLVNDYIEAYAFYDDLDVEATKEERKRIIKTLIKK